MAPNTFEEVLTRMLSAFRACWSSILPQQGWVGGVSGLTDQGAMLAGAQAAAFQPSHESVKHIEEQSAPLFDGTLEEFAHARGNSHPTLTVQLRNVVRRCMHCGKANGFTMTACNGCNAPFPKGQQTTHTPNVFMGFIYGVARTDAFPLIISIRRQTRESLVFDDPLALTPCHLNVIPTESWVADWRMLLRNPKEGLHLITRLEKEAWECVATQFLSCDIWCKKMLRCGRPTDPEQLRPYIISGCNFPPSQFQLHIQYFLMPWLPCQYRPFLDGNQMVEGRWFPLEYIKRVLALDDPMAVTIDTPLSEIFAKYDGRVPYRASVKAAYAQVNAGHGKLANWQPADFTLAIMSGKVTGDSDGRSSLEVIADDKKTMQSTAPQTSKTYYKYARTEPVPEWGKVELARLLRSATGL